MCIIFSKVCVLFKAQFPIELENATRFSFYAAKVSFHMRCDLRRKTPWTFYLTYFMNMYFCKKNTTRTAYKEKLLSFSCFFPWLRQMFKLCRNSTTITVAKKLIICSALKASLKSFQKLARSYLFSGFEFLKEIICSSRKKKKCSNLS